MLVGFLTGGDGILLGGCMFKFGLAASFLRLITKPLGKMYYFLYGLELNAATKYMIKKNLWKDGKQEMHNLSEEGTFTICRAIKQGRRYSRVEGKWYFD